MKLKISGGPTCQNVKVILVDGEREIAITGIQKLAIHPLEVGGEIRVDLTITSVQLYVDVDSLINITKTNELA